MNMNTLHPPEKAVSAVPLFQSEKASVTAVQILQGEALKKHMTKVPALLLCVIGKVVFENEKGVQESLQPGDYVKITPMVIHWVNALEDSQLILFK
jgi:quercetin dioxygenase-like cupin family protein